MWPRVWMTDVSASELTSGSADALSGVRRAVRHLAALGHRRIGYVGGPRPSRSDAERRLALDEVGTDLGVEIVDVGHYRPSIEGGSTAGEAVLLHELRAVMVYNDVMALGLIAGLRSEERRVGRERR